MSGVHVAPDAEAAAAVTAERLAELVEAAQEERGAVHLALAGGSTPRRVYELLARRLERWDGVELWFGDERAVAPDDPASNYRMVAETLLAETPVPAERVHRIEGERGSEEAARRYAELLRSRLPLDEEGVPVLDVVLLGMGQDGHTASIFPGDLAPMGGGLCVAVHDAPKPPPERVTLTLDVLHAARRRVLVATGAAKRSATRALVAGLDPDQPVSLLAGPGTDLVTDRAAAPELPDDAAEAAGAAPIQHVSLETRPADVPACRDFYALLGFRPTTPPAALVDRAVWLRRGDDHVHLLLTDDPVVPPRAHFAVVAEDYDRITTALTSAGRPPEPRDEHWGAARSYVRDPAGHLVELMAAAPPAP